MAAGRSYTPRKLLNQSWHVMSFCSLALLKHRMYLKPGVVHNASSVSSIGVPGPPEEVGDGVVGPIVADACVLQVEGEGVVECSVIRIGQPAASLTCT